MDVLLRMLTGVTLSLTLRLHGVFTLAHDEGKDASDFRCFTCAEFQAPSYFRDPCRDEYTKPCARGVCLSFDVLTKMGSRAIPFFSFNMDASIKICPDEMPQAIIDDILAQSSDGQSFDLGCRPLRVQNPKATMTKLVQHFLGNMPLAKTLYLKEEKSNATNEVVFTCACNESLCNRNIPPTEGMPGKNETVADALRYLKSKPPPDDDAIVNYLLKSTFGDFKLPATPKVEVKELESNARHPERFSHHMLIISSSLLLIKFFAYNSYA